MEHNGRRILVISSKDSMAERVRRILADFHILWIDGCQDIPKMFSETTWQKPDAILAAVDDASTITFLDKHFPGSSIIAVVATYDVTFCRDLIRSGAQTFLLETDLNADNLSRIIRNSIERTSRITDLKTAYQALQLSEQRFSKLFNANPISAMTLNDFHTGAFIEVNDLFLEMMNVTREEAIGRTGTELGLWKDTTLRNTLASAVKNGYPVKNHQVQLVARSGRLIDVLFSMDVLQLDEGPVFISMAIDISERVAAERKFTESERNLDTLIDSSPDQIWLVDAQLNLVKANRAFFDIIKSFRGLDIKIGDNVLDLFDNHPQTSAMWKMFYREALRGQSVNRIVDDKNPDLVPFSFEINLNPVFDKNDTVIGIGCFCRDITERKKAATRLEEANNRFELISNATNDAIWDWNLVDDSIQWNHGLTTLFGYHDKQVSCTGKWWAGNVHISDRSRVTSSLSLAFDRKDERWSEMYSFQCADGKFKHVYDRGFLVYENGKPVRMIGVMQDIDPLFKANEQIKTLSLVASNTDNLVIITDKYERIEWVNAGFERLTGYTLSEVKGKRPKDVLQGALTERAPLDRIRKALDAATPITEEVLNYTKDGRKIWLKMNITPIFSDNGQVERFVSVETDVTLHKEYASNITAIARDLADLIENANAIIFGVDRNGYINEWNRQAAKLTGFTKNETLERKVTNFLVPKESRETVAQLFADALCGSPVNQYELPVMDCNKQRLIFLVSISPRKNSKGEVIALLVVGQDITELTDYRQSLEKKVDLRTAELQQALEKEKEFSTLKARFAAMVSHEFRTPLSTIKLAASHVKRYKAQLSSEAIDQKIEIIKQQVLHMTHLLEDVLTLGRAEENVIKISKAPVDVIDFFNRIKREVLDEYKSGHVIHLSIGLPERIMYTDEGLLRNIFINLLSNAIKFSPSRKPISISGAYRDGMVHLSVSDNGMGIAETDVDKIFEPFHRGANALTVQGTGLGLPIAKKAVDLLKGSISVTSKSGMGTTFSVTIPYSEWLSES